MTSTFYRHLDGGYYRFVAEARDADDLSTLVVYEHLWPFDQSLWVRDAKVFYSRFSIVEESTVIEARKGEREAAQLAVANHKRERRLREGKA